MKKVFLLLVLVVAGAAMAAPASPVDRKALRDMAEASLAEAQAGKLALEKAERDDVKQLARQVVEGHTLLLDATKRLAQAKGVDLPQRLKAKHQATLRQLRATGGGRFDKAYLSAILNDHRETLDALESIAKNAHDPDVKAAAERALSRLQRHLHMAQQVAHAERSAATGGTARRSR